MSTRCQCGKTKRVQDLLCRGCWALVDPMTQRAVLAGFRRAKTAARQLAIPLFRALAADPDYMAARREAQAQARAGGAR